MTLEEKEVLDERLERANVKLDADYYRAQSDAEKFYALYLYHRDKATDYHEQLLIILQAKIDLWKEENL